MSLLLSFDKASTDAVLCLHCQRKIPQQCKLFTNFNSFIQRICYGRMQLIHKYNNNKTCQKTTGKICMCHRNFHWNL